MKMNPIKILHVLAVALTWGISVSQTLAAPTQEQQDVAQKLWKSAETAWNAKTPAQCLDPLNKILALDKETVPRDMRRRAQGLLGESLNKLDRRAEARQAYEKFIAEEPSGDQRQDWWLSIARIYETEKNIPAVMMALENILVGQADKVGTKHWYTALNMTVDYKARQGDPAATLEAARDCLALASNREQVNSAVGRVKQSLQDLDKNRDRAKIFVDYQRLGPAGEDGQTGTADDLVNPLDSIPRAAPPANRVAAFAAAEKTLGNDTQSLIQRGMMESLLGHQKEACAVLIEACRRAAGDDVELAYRSLIFLGVRGVRGNSADLSGYIAYLRQGPGPDKTLDPFASLGLPQWKPTPSPSDEDTLRYAVQRLEGIVTDGNWPEKGRRHAASSLLTLHSALGDWGDVRVLNWYAMRLEAEKDDWTQQPLTHGFLAASRGGRLDWGETPGHLVSGAYLPAMQKVLSRPQSVPPQLLDKIEKETLKH